MRAFFTIGLILASQIGFGQHQNVAVIVDDDSGKFDVVFFSKIILLFVIAIIALISFVNYQKEEKSTNTK